MHWKLFILEGYPYYRLPPGLIKFTEGHARRNRAAAGPARATAGLGQGGWAAAGLVGRRTDPPLAAAWAKLAAARLGWGFGGGSFPECTEVCEH